MDVTGLFSRGVDILKKNPVVAIPLVVVGIVMGVITTALLGGVTAGVGMMGPGAFSLGAIGALLGAAFLVGLIGWFLDLVGMGMTFVMVDDATKGKADLNSGLQRTMGNITNLVVASILAVVIVAIGTLLLFIPGLVAAYLLMFTIPLVMLGNRGPTQALKESFDLVKSHVGDTIVFAVIAVVILVVAGIIGGIFGVIPVLGSVIIAPIISGTAMAYISIVLVLLYTELKK